MMKIFLNTHLNFLSIFDMTSVSECITFYEIDIKNDEEDEEKENFVEYCKKTKQQQQHVIVWTCRYYK